MPLAWILLLAVIKKSKKKIMTESVIVNTAHLIDLNGLNFRKTGAFLMRVPHEIH
jgi:hypothetical protein